MTVPRAAIDVWQIDLEQAAADLPALLPLLAPAERARMERYYFERDQRQYAICRGALRILLGQRLGIAPQSLTFTTNAYGKPLLEGAGWHFNVSHAGSHALIALRANGPVGVDIEQMRTDIDLLSLGRHTFAAAEADALDALPPDQQPQGFYNCWTRKEAMIKARGEGLSLPLTSFVVSLTPNAPAALLSADWAASPDTWQLVAWTPASGYVAALAIEGAVPVLRHHAWGRV